MDTYTPQGYIELNINEYRDRFPAETARLTDKQLYDVVMGTEDDLEDDEWRKLFSTDNVPTG